MNIAICEDELIYATGMQIAIQTWVQSRNYTDIQILLYSSAEDLWDDWERGKVFDALFLDIEFQHMSGFELAQRIRCADPNIPIIFVTNSNRYLIQGYEVSAYRYLLKPIRQEEISACLDYCYQFTQTMLHDDAERAHRSAALSRCALHNVRCTFYIHLYSLSTNLSHSA